MIYSLESIHGSSQFYNSYQWSVKFDSENILQSGGSIGATIPATSVSEDIFKIEYEQLPVGPLTIPMPLSVNYTGTVTVSFYDNGRPGSLLSIHKFLLDWAHSIHVDNQFKSINSSIKKIEIYRYSREAGDSLKSIYLVLPPDVSKIDNSNAVSLLEGGVTFQIVKVVKLIEN